MLDAAQIFRQTVNTTQFDTTVGVTAQPKDVPTETGSAMGFVVKADADPMQELMDSMEELSFQFEEKEAKSVSERKLGEAKGRGNAYAQAIEEWMKTLPDMPDSAFLQRLLRQCRQAQPMPDAQQLLKWLGQGGGSEDPSHQFAMLECLEKALGEGEAELRGLFSGARESLERAKGPEIRAGINLAETVNARATNPGEMQDLRAMYRGEVLGFSTPQNCFRSLLASRGPGQLAAAIDFLTAASGADLQSASPSQSPEELRRILLDLQCVEVLRTVLDKMEGLAGRMQQQFGETSLLNGEKLTGRVVDMTEQAFVSSGDMDGLVTSCGLRALLAKMDFMREMTGVFRGLSPRLFEEAAARFRLVDAAQESLNRLVEQVEDEEEERKRRKKKPGGESGEEDAA